MTSNRGGRFSRGERFLAAAPVLMTPVLVWMFVRELPQNAWDWTRELTLLLSWAQLPSLLVALAWWQGWRGAGWGNAALVCFALVSAVMDWLLGVVVWPTVVINLPGLLVALVSRHRWRMIQRQSRL